MPWFMCESCGETLKKPKVKAHAHRCAADAFSCIDCSATFDRWSVHGHVSCVTEHEKYALGATKGAAGHERARAVAAEGTRFATSGINVGLFCSTPAVPVSRNISRKRAMELLLTGEFIDAETALNWGLLNRVVPVKKIDEETQKLAEAILSKSSLAVFTGKKMFYKQLEHKMEDAYTFAGKIMACNMMAEDVSEGVDAFINKRQAVWKGC